MIFKKNYKGPFLAMLYPSIPPVAVNTVYLIYPLLGSTELFIFKYWSICLLC
jgi:hypothetical protein